MNESRLVSTDWLAERLGDPEIVVLDASWFMPGDGARRRAPSTPPATFPARCFFDIDEITDHASPLPHMLAAPPDFAMAARRLGVERELDRRGLRRRRACSRPPRVWWNFRAMGHDAVFVLDGGLPNWIAEGRPVETGWREPAHGEFKAHPRPAWCATWRRCAPRWPRRRRRSSTPARPPASAARRPSPAPGLRAGHMPGAHNLPCGRLVDRRRTLLAARARCGPPFEEAGVDLGRGRSSPPAARAISAAILALALARLGRVDVAVYDGSWTEWGAPGGHAGRRRARERSAKGGPPSATRLIRAGHRRPLLRTVGPPIQQGSTVLLPNAAALYDDASPDLRPRRPGDARRRWPSALAELEGATCGAALPLRPRRRDRRDAGGAEGRRRGAGHRRRLQAHAPVLRPGAEPLRRRRPLLPAARLAGGR